MIGHIQIFTAHLTQDQRRAVCAHSGQTLGSSAPAWAMKRVIYKARNFIISYRRILTSWHESI